jgi:hypothetical protein
MADDGERPRLDPARTLMVTGSDVAAVCGESPWASWRDVLEKKARAALNPGAALREDEERATPAMLHGREHEAAALAAFAHVTDARLDTTSQLRRAPDAPWLGGTLDALATMPDGTMAVVETKCPYRRAISDDIVPSHYAQMQTYLRVVPEAACAYYVQYRPAARRADAELSIQRVERDMWYMAMRMPRLARFVALLEARVAHAHAAAVLIKRWWRGRRGAPKGGTRQPSCLRSAVASFVRARVHVAACEKEFGSVCSGATAGGVQCHVLAGPDAPPDRPSGPCHVIASAGMPPSR